MVKCLFVILLFVKKDYKLVKKLWIYRTRNIEIGCWIFLIHLFRSPHLFYKVKVSIEVRIHNILHFFLFTHQAKIQIWSMVKLIPWNLVNLSHLYPLCTPTSNGSEDGSIIWCFCHMSLFSRWSLLTLKWGMNVAWASLAWRAPASGGGPGYIVLV